MPGDFRGKSGTPISATAAMRVAAELRIRILNGELSPGQRIKIDEIADMLEVSHMPVRVALQELEAEGILQVFPYRGTIIRGVDERFVRNLYDVRGAIESMMAERCAQRITPEQLERLRGAGEAFALAAGAGNPMDLMRANSTLHEVINSVADNPEALRVLSQGRLLVEAIRVRYGYQPERVAELIAEHSALIEAIAQGDARRAGELARLHCEGSRDDLLGMLGKAAATG